MLMGHLDGDQDMLLSLGNSLCGDSLFMLSPEKGSVGGKLDAMLQGSQGEERGPRDAAGAAAVPGSGVADIIGEGVSLLAQDVGEGSGNAGLVLSDRCFEVLFGAHSRQALM